jgi:hypothetical protein
VKKRLCPSCGAAIQARTSSGAKRSTGSGALNPHANSRLVVPYRKSYLERFADRDAEEPKKPVRLPE